MKKTIIAVLAAAVAIASCSKSAETEKNKINSDVFDSWLYLNGYENLPRLVDGMRIYIMDETVGTGEAVGTADDHPYVRVEYNLCDLNGNVTTTTYKEVAQRLGNYTDDATYYGPAIWSRADNGLYAGIEYMLEHMKVGGTLKCAVPGWYQSSDRYSTDAEYMANTEGTDYIYELHVTDVFDDVTKWELDSLQSFVKNRYPQAEELDTAGVYYSRLRGPVSEQDTTVVGSSYKINYIGRLLNGQVFDTNIKDTAIFYGLTVSNSGEPTTFTNASEASDVTLGSNSSSVITGFALGLMNMKIGEKGLVMFVSDFGYGTSGSGSTIPGYSPLMFELEIIEKND